MEPLRWRRSNRHRRRFALSSTSLNVTVFDWNNRRERAAQLVADDTASDELIAAELKIAKRTLERWKQHPDFRARVQSILDGYREAIRAEGIANKQNRVDALNERWALMQQVIEERAASHEMQDVPGGTTGLILKQEKSVGFGGNNTIVEEYVVDTALLKELRAHEQQAAQELGQWTEKSEQSGSLTIKVVYDDGLGNSAETPS